LAAVPAATAVLVVVELSVVTAAVPIAETVQAVGRRLQAAVLLPLLLGLV
jgi:hypothetical protein